MSGAVHAVVWIVEGTWEAAVDAVPPDASVTLVHVAIDPEDIRRATRRGLLGRHPPPPPGPDPVSTASEEEQRALLGEAAARLGREARIEARRGRAEEEVIAALGDADLLVLARDGERDRPGPHSLRPPTRFVLDHAPCDVLLVWAAEG
jgi:nucleotide-binding universal stress UspA family protein